MTPTPNDPLFALSWHLRNTGQTGGTPGVDINVTSVWPLYTGRGIVVGVVDDGVQASHPDLAGALLPGLAGPINGEPASYDHHGTPVAGLILARGDNGLGSVGVAPEAGLTSYRYDALPGEADTPEMREDMARGFRQALADGVDVLNNSWGFSPEFTTQAPAMLDALADLGELGRDGLGTVVVFSNGNDRGWYSSNTDPLRTSPYTIAVAAVNRDGVVMGYSTPGANLLVSAPSNVLTTDVTGGGGYVEDSDYTSFGGTSAAAPLVSGVAALMLDANPNLGLRDVHEILAYTARQLQPGNAGWVETAAGNANGGGLFHSSDYGFGLVDAAAAVRLAETWRVVRPATDWTELSAGAAATPGITFSDGSASSVFTTTFTFAPENGATGAARVNRVLLDLDLTVKDVSRLDIALVSPSGTRITLLHGPVNGEPDPVTGYWTADWPEDGWTLGSPAWWGEEAAGTWTLSISLLPGAAGAEEDWIFESATLRILGDDPAGPDLRQQMILTESYARLAGLDAARRLLGGNGETVLNAAAMESAVSVDLRAAAAGGTGRIAGVKVTFAAGSGIVDAFGGAGADRFGGSDAANILWGGWGDDTLVGRGGADDLVGGIGNDSLSGGEGADLLAAGLGHDTASGGAGADTVTGGEGEDSLAGNDGDDSLLGDGGSDTLLGGDGKDRLWGGAGTDSLLGGSDGDRLYGNDGADTILGGAGYDLLDGGLDDDLLFGGEGGDLLLGGGGADSLFGGTSTDELRGGAGDDLLLGEGANDTLYGDGGQDTLRGGAGADELTGGAGHDSLLGGHGDDILEGDVSYDLSFAFEASGSDTLRGGAGNDRLSGDAINADDTLGGADELYGDAGNDTLTGGYGADTLKGGEGADIFVWAKLAHSRVEAPDLVLDFSPEDRLDLTSREVFGNATPYFIGTDPFYGIPGDADIRYSIEDGSVLLEIDADGDAAADLAIRFLGLSEFRPGWIHV
jgi:Ca2+-binding RTX toxin-like protein